MELREHWYLFINAVSKERVGFRCCVPSPGCPPSVTTCRVMFWGLGTPSPGALGRSVCSRALCCCFLSEQLPDTAGESHDSCTAKQVCPLLRSSLLEGWSLSSAFSCSAQHWGGRKGHGVPWKNAVAGLKIDSLGMTWEPTKPKEFVVCCYHLCNSSLNHWLQRRISLWLPWECQWLPSLQCVMEDKQLGALTI